jgi:hypothetical protein
MVYECLFEVSGKQLDTLQQPNNNHSLSSAWLISGIGESQRSWQTREVFEAKS